MARLCCLTQLGMLLMGVCKVIISPGGVEVSFTWSDRYGEFATTYRPRASSDKSNMRLGGNGGNLGGNGVNLGGNDDAGHTAEIIDSIKQYPSISSAERARLVKVSQRSMERTLRKLKEEGKIRRIGGTRGHWEVLS